MVNYAENTFSTRDQNNYIRFDNSIIAVCSFIMNRESLAKTTLANLSMTRV